MLYGSLFSLLLGVVWTLVAVTMMYASRAKCRVDHFYIIASLGAALLICLYQLATGSFIPEQWSWITAACMVGGSVANALANYCTMLNLRHGGAAVYFALGRIGFALSFLWTVVFWGSRITPFNGIGLACLVTAVILSSLKKQSGGATAAQGGNRICLLLAMLSSMASATTHILFIFPTTAAFQAPPLPPMTKTLLIMMTNVAVFTCTALCKKSTTKPSYGILVKSALTWSVLAVLSYAVLFTALKYLNAVGQPGIAYPVGGAIQIIGLAVYARFFAKEKLSRNQNIAIALILIGIFAIEL